VRTVMDAFLDVTVNESQFNYDMDWVYGFHVVAYTYCNDV